MLQSMSNAPMLVAFLGASFLLAVTPGPGVFYIVTRSVSQGRRCGLASVAGVAAGNWCNAIGAAIGLAALFAVSSIAFTVVKWVGAAYLVCLGAKTILGRSLTPDVAGVRAAPAARIFRDGFLVALLNPKTVVFFAAFLPQFMSPDFNPIAQGILLGSVFVAIAAITDSAYALAASSISGLFSRSMIVQRGGRFLSGGAFIGLGAFTALTGSNTAGR